MHQVSRTLAHTYTHPCIHTRLLVLALVPLANESMVTAKSKFPCVPWPFSSLKAKLLLVQLWGDGERQRRLDRLRRASQGGGARGREGSKGSRMKEKVEWGKRGRICFSRPFRVGISCSCTPASASPSHRSPIVHSCKCNHPLSSLQSFPYHSASLICHITLIFHQLHLRILFNVSFLPPHMCVCIRCLFLTTFHLFSVNTSVLPRLDPSRWWDP